MNDAIDRIGNETIYDLYHSRKSAEDILNEGIEKCLDLLPEGIRQEGRSRIAVLLVFMILISPPDFDERLKKAGTKAERLRLRQKKNAYIRWLYHDPQNRKEKEQAIDMFTQYCIEGKDEKEISRGGFFNMLGNDPVFQEYLNAAEECQNR
ncbi:MAG: hypothetical protein LIO68_00070 [Rikenellaceae bacterium]|nr:hypothetical protein [Rikenellaceae bacterium]